MIDMLENDMANTFTYHLFGDKGVTGNFEITLFHNADLSGDSHAVWSKKALGAFPYDDGEKWEQFVAAIEHAKH